MLPSFAFHDRFIIFYITLHYRPQIQAIIMQFFRCHLYKKKIGQKLGFDLLASLSCHEFIEFVFFFIVMYASIYFKTNCNVQELLMATLRG